MRRKGYEQKTGKFEIRNSKQIQSTKFKIRNNHINLSYCMSFPRRRESRITFIDKGTRFNKDKLGRQNALSEFIFVGAFN